MTTPSKIQIIENICAEVRRIKKHLETIRHRIEYVEAKIAASGGHRPQGGYLEAEFHALKYATWLMEREDVEKRKFLELVRAREQERVDDERSKQN